MVKSLLHVFLFFSAAQAFSRPGVGLKLLCSYPINGAQNVHPGTNIGVTFSDALSLSTLSGDSISVSCGEKQFSGKLRLSKNHRTLIFIPGESFPMGKAISVRCGSLTTIDGESTQPFTLTFTIREKIATRDFGNDLLFNSEPNNKPFSFDTLPQIVVLKNDNPSSGYIYIANYTWHPSQPLTYGIVLDKDGKVRNVMGNGADYYNDFRPHRDGTYSFFSVIKNKFYFTDTNFSVIDSISAPNGYITDGHELRITSDNHYFFIANDFIEYDMSKIIDQGKNPAIVAIPIVLEYDEDKNLVFEWRSIDHFSISDAMYEDMRAPKIDFCHINAIALDGEDELLLSCRNMSEITKIDKETGMIIWRWGGKNNQFQFVGDTLPFSYQHAIRKTGEDTYTMFDNGNFHHSNENFSRAVEYRIDEQKKTAAKIWEFRHKPDVVSGAMGFVHRLQNKSTLIGWGECDSVSITEVDSNNVTRFEMVMPGGTYSYRAYKYDTNYIQLSATNTVGNAAELSNNTLSCDQNPVAGKAQISCSLNKDAYAAVDIFDQLGRQISNIYQGYLSQGIHQFEFDTREMFSGAYYLSLKLVDSIPVIRKIIAQQ